MDIVGGFAAPAAFEGEVQRCQGRAPLDPLLSIGVFSRRSRLSMKALRLYHRLGLLTPAMSTLTPAIDAIESQLVIARLVVMLRRLDMPLAHVAEVVSAPGPLAVQSG